MDQSERIKHAMQTAGITRAQVAAGCGVTVQAVYKWHADPSINLKSEHLFQLADMTGFNARWIATGRGPERGQDGQETGLLTHYRQASAEAQQAILRVAESLSTGYKSNEYAGEKPEEVKQITTASTHNEENEGRLPDAGKHVKEFLTSDRRRKKTADG